MFLRVWATFGVAAIAAVVGGLFTMVPTSNAVERLAREDFRIKTADGVGIHVREVGPNALRDREPLILVHGARVPGIASFDLDILNGSVAEDLARLTGRTIFIMDARGYGGSDRPDAMNRPVQDSQPLSRAFEVVRDIDGVVNAVRQRTGARTVALLGWATGGMWAAYYASLWPERVNYLITLNSLYGGSDHHQTLGPGSPVADPAFPDRLNAATGGYALYDASSLLPSWDRTIPIDNKNAWRDPAIVEAYSRATLDSDPESYTHQPPAFRAPMVAIEDSFYQASGRRLFDASSITAAILVVRSALDFWSRPEDAQALAHDATHAKRVRIVSLQNATHYVHLDRRERGRSTLLREVVEFLDESGAPKTSN